MPLNLKCRILRRLQSHTKLDQLNKHLSTVECFHRSRAICILPSRT